MRVSVSLSICTALALALGATTASAQMNADEIFNRLKAQADATGTVQAAPGSTTRGLAVIYDNEAPEPSAAAPAPSVVAVPAAPAESAGTSVAVAPAAAAPAYVEPASVAVFAPQPAPATTVVAPSYQAASPEPAYVMESPAAATPSFQTVAPASVATTPVAVREDPTVYRAVEEEKRVDLRIYFEWNSASLKPEAIGQLAELCTAIRRVGASSEKQFKIIGHTDKSGSDDYNLYLSNARAREVKRHLVEECALPADALLAVGEGERQSSPSAPANAPEERRVEIQLVS